MHSRKLRVAVLMGGPSSEYEISLATGKKILAALDPGTYLAQPVIVTKERKWLIPPKAILEAKLTKAALPAAEPPAFSTALIPREESEALAVMCSGGADVAFIAMHGEFGEDGTVQGLLEAAGIPYTGSGVLASALGMDKPRSRAVFQAAGLRASDFRVWNREAWRRASRRIADDAAACFGLPLVVKPANRGSSVGVSIVRRREDLEAAFAEGFAHSDTVMAERFIPGSEVTCGVLETGEAGRALQPTEIIPQERDFFDYHSKYTPGATEEITPPRLPTETIRRIQEAALTAHRAVGCSGMSRTDMILDRNNKLYILEINTIPGMTETSLLPQAASAAGISFPRLLDLIIASALQNRRQVEKRA